MTTTDEVRQEIRDEEHLRLLVLVYYIRAGITAFFAFVPVIYMIMGAMMLGIFSHMEVKPGEPSPAIMGWVFIGMGIIATVIIATFATLQFFAGRFISQRKHRTFCFVVAGLNCLGVPYGTALSVMTFIVLTRNSVKEKFRPKNAIALTG